MRYNSGALLLALDLTGTFVFAVEGAGAAVMAHLDLLGILVLSFASRAWRYGAVAFPGAALAGAAAMIAGLRIGGSRTAMTILGAGVCFSLRMVAVWQHWNLPKAL